MIQEKPEHDVEQKKPDTEEHKLQESVEEEFRNRWRISSANSHWLPVEGQLPP